MGRHDLFGEERREEYMKDHLGRKRRIHWKGVTWKVEEGREH